MDVFAVATTSNDDAGGGLFGMPFSHCPLDLVPGTYFKVADLCSLFLSLLLPIRGAFQDRATCQWFSSRRLFGATGRLEPNFFFTTD